MFLFNNSKFSNPMQQSISLFCLFSLLFLLSCQKDNLNFASEAEDPIRSFSRVDQELWTYFEQFEKEAASRGLDIDLNQEAVVGKIEEIDEQNIAGVCNYNSHFPNQITVDQSFWERATPLFKEFIVFHELGHCSLLRDHVETATTSGICTSIMRSGSGGCRDNYNFQTREAYLDELFLNLDGPSISVSGR